MLRLLALLCLAVCLTSCGFHLRGGTTLNPPLQKLYLKTADPYGQLANNLRNYLKVSGTPFVDSKEEATAILQILSENENQQLINVSSTQQTRQYNLILTVTFQITDPQGKILIPLQSLSESRAFTTVSDQILGGTNEQNALTQQMRKAIVFDIMNRLGSNDISTQLTTQKAPP
ncbi:MAG: hypothetical protein ACD_45C00053G0004 [uncultured bacterium]|nr:MAG: hypothetical protein ACD_45C00053G0004 [uncultured bacterium]